MCIGICECPPCLITGRGTYHALPTCDWTLRGRTIENSTTTTRVRSCEKIKVPVPVLASVYSTMSAASGGGLNGSGGGGGGGSGGGAKVALQSGSDRWCKGRVGRLAAYGQVEGWGALTTRYYFDILTLFWIGLLYPRPNAQIWKNAMRQWHAAKYYCMVISFFLCFGVYV